MSLCASHVCEPAEARKGPWVHAAGVTDVGELPRGSSVRVAKAHKPPLPLQA